jgi:Domain of unknown function (DUF4919)
MTHRIVLFGLLLLGGLATAQDKPAPPAAVSPPAAAAPSAQYEEMKKRVLAGDMTVDFRAFRLAGILAAGPQAGMHENVDRQAFRRAVAGGDFQVGLDMANKALDRNYASIVNHFDAMIACQRLQKADEAALHEKVLRAMLDSIQQSGDGKTAATAWFVVTTPEEYIFLSRVLGLRATKQGLIQQNAHAYDVLDVVDPKTNATQKIWFNCDVDMGLYKPPVTPEAPPKVP